MKRKLYMNNFKNWHIILFFVFTMVGSDNTTLRYRFNEV